MLRPPATSPPRASGRRCPAEQTSIQRRVYEAQKGSRPTPPLAEGAQRSHSMDGPPHIACAKRESRRLNSGTKGASTPARRRRAELHSAQVVAAGVDVLGDEVRDPL